VSARDEPVRLGVLGTGFISAVHIAAAARSPGIELVAVASVRGRATAERTGPLDGVRLLTLDELLGGDDVEAVVVCTRTSDHAAHAVEVLRRRKHLLLEKPGGVTLADHRAIAAAAAELPGIVARVAYHRRFDHRFVELARIAGSGAIGKPIAVQMSSREDFPPSDADAAAGGFIMDVGVHDFDTARWLLGRDPESVFTLVHSPVYRDTAVDNAYVTISLGDAVATTHLSRTSAVGMDIRCEVIGTGGSAVVTDAPGGGGGVAVLAAGAEPAFPADCTVRFAAAYDSQLDGFAAACRGAETANATLEDDRWAVATAVAARASGARREPLEVGPDWAWEMA
jgi:predicted dehydrogenase